MPISQATPRYPNRRRLIRNAGIRVQAALRRASAKPRCTTKSAGVARPLTTWIQSHTGPTRGPTADCQVTTSPLTMQVATIAISR